MGRIISLLVAFTLVLATQAHANDSASVLAAGGLEFIKTDAITMQREDLYLSPTKVRIRYEMRNDGNAPVTLRVAFPLPELPLLGVSGYYIQRGNDTIAYGMEMSSQRPDFMDFFVGVNGKRVQADVEIHALLPEGRDITDRLREIGGWHLVLNPTTYVNNIGLTSDGSEYDRDIGPSLTRQLLAIGAVEGDATTGAPAWRTHITYHWQQTFEPGVTVVEHEYTPVLGAFHFGIRDGKWVGGAIGDPDAPLDQTYCLQPAQLTELAAIERGDRDLTAQTLGYILTTGANWAGPIGTFHLTVDGSNYWPSRSPIIMTSLCSDLALHQTGPVNFETLVTDYTPRTDLRVLFVLQP